jgi:methanesulfonate monooxygenase small subunit
MGTLDEPDAEQSSAALLPANSRRGGITVPGRRSRWRGEAVEAHRLVSDLIYRATLMLDEQKWEEWLGLCDEGFQYAIKAWSPEINYDMTYLQLDHAGLANLVKLLPKHNTDHSLLRRHTTVYTVDPAEDGKSARAVSSFLVHQNLLDGVNSHIDAGESRLFLIGKYRDVVGLENGKARFLSREVRIDNRRLDKGSHWPI